MLGRKIDDVRANLSNPSSVQLAAIDFTTSLSYQHAGADYELEIQSINLRKYDIILKYSVFCSRLSPVIYSKYLFWSLSGQKRLRTKG
jgi:hypothetical protein